jgi:hypothetical protein
VAHSQFDIFLQEATYRDQASEHTLSRDRLYGLYISWCFINQEAVSAEDSFWAAMGDRFNPDRNSLRMKGPAATDYILTSYPGLV